MQKLNSIIAGLFAALSILAAASGCSSMVTSATNRLADNLSAAIANHDDVATVKAGAPAYLLMMDALVAGNPDDASLLAKASELYTAFAGSFVQDAERSRKLTARALAYAEDAACLSDPQDCTLRELPFDHFKRRISRLSKNHVPIHYTLGAAWAGWIQVRTNDFDALAELSRVESLMRRMLELDEGHRQGSVHIYLGTLAILMPPALGGNSESAEKHFKRAIQLSNGHNLMAKVMFARHYARMLFNRPLHDRLLEEVLAADPNHPGYVLVNSMAKQQAKRLLATAEDYF